MLDEVATVLVTARKRAGRKRVSRSSRVCTKVCRGADLIYLAQIQQDRQSLQPYVTCMVTNAWTRWRLTVLALACAKVEAQVIVAMEKARQRNGRVNIVSARRIRYYLHVRQTLFPRDVGPTEQISSVEG